MADIEFYTKLFLNANRFAMIGNHLWHFNGRGWDFRSKEELAAFFVQSIAVNDEIWLEAKDARAIVDEVRHRVPRIDRNANWRRRWHIKQKPGCTDSGVQEPRSDYAILFPNGVFFAHRYVAGKKNCFWPRPTPSSLFLQDETSYEYDPDAQCPLWLKCVDEWLVTQEDKDRLQEWFGLCMVYENRWQSLMVFFGPKRTGKSTAKKILEGLIPDKLRSAVQLDRLGDNFSNGELMGKLLNVSPDIPAMQLSRTQEGNLKAYAAGDVISHNRKHQEGVSVQPTARLLLLANEWPRIRDRSGAITDRMLGICFPNTLDLGKRNLLLDHQLMAELPGIFNYAMVGLRRLHEQGRFTTGPSMKKLIDDFVMQSSHIERFFEEVLVRDGGNFLPTRTLMQEYKRWAESHGVSPNDWVDDGELVRAVKGRFGAESERRRLPGADNHSGKLSGLKGIKLQKVADEQETHAAYLDRRDAELKEKAENLAVRERELNEWKRRLDDDEGRLKYRQKQVDTGLVDPPDDIAELLEEIEQRDALAEKEANQ